MEIYNTMSSKGKKTDIRSCLRKHMMNINSIT